MTPATQKPMMVNKQVDPEMPGQTHLQEDAQRREEEREDHLEQVRDGDGHATHASPAAGPREPAIMPIMGPWRR